MTERVGYHSLSVSIVVILQGAYDFSATGDGIVE